MKYKKGNANKNILTQNKYAFEINIYKYIYKCLLAGEIKTFVFVNNNTWYAFHTRKKIANSKDEKRKR